jgi:hypothetical protein
MKKIFAGIPHTIFIAAASALTWTIAMANSAGAAQLQEARVTQVVNDVKLLLEQSAPRPATISDLIRHGTAVRTGTQSRSELTFADLTITRLGANTIFSFKEGTREMTLIDGAILFQVPKGSGGATIRTVGVTAAITGTTGIAEFHPATTSHPQLSKWLCLEGTFHLYLPNGQSVELGPGKIVTADGKSFSKVMTFDIAKLTSTSLFFTGFDQPLASMNLIMLESQNQLASSLLATTTNPLDPTRIVNVTSQAIVAEETQTSPPASPTPPITPTPSVSPTPPPPTPSKFGTPSVISSPVPYRITNGTVITTDPSITTNGITDYGKIYRGQNDDGPFSLWAFGSTSAFDTALRIDDIFFADPSHLPIAVFKFERLSLTGDPTIDTTNGVSKLGLIGVDGITSGPPGGALTFTGLDLLLLATVNGSINLSSNVSFRDLHELVMYARGAGSDLTINSPISNVGILGLIAEDSLHLTNPGTMSIGKLDAITGGDLVLQIGGSLLLNGRVSLDAIVLPGASVASGINLTLNVTGDYTNSSATQFSHLAITNRDHIGGDANITVGATNISTANSLDLQIANQRVLADPAGGHIGEDARINVAASNDINIVGDAAFQILNNESGHIGRDANILVTTGAGGDFRANSTFVFINNRNGGSIGSGANLTFDIGGALITQTNATTGENAGESLALLISNRNDGRGGGTISGDVSLTLNAASASIGGNLLAGISTNAGGNIAGSALNNVAIAGDLMTGDAVFDVQNTGFNNTGFLGGGTIGVDAVVNLSANNILAGGVLDVELDNDGGGHIGRDGLINIISHNINAQGDVLFGIFNNALNGSPAGTIGGDATVNITAASLTANSLLAQIDNTGGSIGANNEGSAMINMNVSNSATVTNDATVAIYGSDGAVGGAGININGGNYNVGGTFLSYIDGNGTITFNNASAHADVLKAGVFGANGVLNIGGGTLSADSTLKLYAPGSNGQLNFISNVTLGGNSVKILAANSITIFNNVVVTIGGPKPADVYTGFTGEIPNANYTGFGGNKSTTGTFAGAGANDPQPLTNAPPFGPASSVKVKTGGNVTSGKKADNVINVRSSDELLALLDRAAPGPGGKITIPVSKNTNKLRDSSRIAAGNRLNVNRRAMDMRSASSLVVRHSPQ